MVKAVHNKHKGEIVKNLISPESMHQAMDWAYDKAVNGVPGLGTAQELAEDYRDESKTPEEQVNSLIRWQNTKAATSGFVTGLGGVVTMPVALPANITSVLYVQIRMIAAIAHLGGYDINDDRVQSLVYVCLAGSSAKDVLKGTGISLGNELTTSMIQRYVTRDVVNAINRAVGFRLVTKFGQTGLVNLGKMVPLIGGAIGGGFDFVATNVIGRVARKTFITGGGPAAHESEIGSSAAYGARQGCIIEGEAEEKPDDAAANPDDRPASPE